MNRKSFIVVCVTACVSPTLAGINAQILDASLYDSDPVVLDTNLGINSSFEIEDFEDGVLLPGLGVSIDGIPGIFQQCGSAVDDEKWDGDCALQNVANGMDGRDVRFDIADGATMFGIGIGHLEQATAIVVNGSVLVSDIRNLSNWTSGGPNVRNGYLWITATSNNQIYSVEFDGNDASDTIFFDHLAILCSDSAAPAHHWGFENSYNDVTGNALGSETNARRCAALFHGHVGNGLALDGDGYVETSYAPQLGPDDPITFSVWARVDGTPGEPVATILGTEETGAQEVRLHVLRDSGNVIASFRDDNAQEVRAMSMSSVLDGEWHHYAAVRDPSRSVVELYIDGELVGEGFGSNGSINVANARPIAIGANNHNNNGFELLFPGLIDELRVYDRALSDDEIMLLAGVDPCPGDVNGDGVVDFNDLVAALFLFGPCD